MTSNQKDKLRQGVVAITLAVSSAGAIGFIDWLDGFGSQAGSAKGK
jgi:hypothetical protein